MPAKPRQPRPKVDQVDNPEPEVIDGPVTAEASPEPEVIDAPDAPEPALADAPATETPEGDQFGRLRVLDTDTGHEQSIFVSQLPHGNYVLVDGPASSGGGDALPPIHNKVPVETTTSGQEAENTEKDNA